MDLPGAYIGSASTLNYKKNHVIRRLIYRYNSSVCNSSNPGVNGGFVPCSLIRVLHVTLNLLGGA